MNPGSSVASPRSITSAPAGSSTFAPTAVILPPVTTTMPGFTSVSLLPSKSLAAFNTYVFLAGACAHAAELHSPAITIMAARRIAVAPRPLVAIRNPFAPDFDHPGRRQYSLNPKTASPFALHLIAQQGTSKTSSRPAKLSPRTAAYNP